jgi:hypothetical protein
MIGSQFVLGMVTAEVLPLTSHSGILPELGFPPPEDCLQVQFHPGASPDWVGTFGKGDIGSDAVVISDDKSFVVVIARGLVYVVDPYRQELIYTLDQSHILHAVPIPNSSLVVAHDWTRLYILGKSAVIWNSRRIAIDGIEITSVNSSSIHGAVVGEEMQSVPFQLNVGTWHYESSLVIPTKLGG